MMKKFRKKLSPSPGMKTSDSERVVKPDEAAAAVPAKHRITHVGHLKLADQVIPCYVTEAGIRVLSGRGMQEALRLVDEEAPKSGQKPGSRMDRFLNNKTLRALLFKLDYQGIFA
jgi:hypothetical protein